jgi:hypothetical protein
MRVRRALEWARLPVRRRKVNLWARAPSGSPENGKTHQRAQLNGARRKNGHPSRESVSEGRLQPYWQMIDNLETFLPCLAFST